MCYQAIQPLSYYLPTKVQQIADMAASFSKIISFLNNIVLLRLFGGNPLLSCSSTTTNKSSDVPELNAANIAVILAVDSMNVAGVAGVTDASCLSIDKKKKNKNGMKNNKWRRMTFDK